MSDFFKSKNFKILASICVVLLAFLLQAMRTGDLGIWIQNVTSAVVAPVQGWTSSVTGSIGDFFGNILTSQRIAQENEQLREEIRKLNEKMIDFEEYKQKNEQYKQFLGLKEENPDFSFVPARVTARDHNDRFGSFVIDQGSAQGISPRDPVITPDGLVGIVSEVGLTSSKVITILDPAVNVGAINIRTSDTGIVNGSIPLAAKGQCRLNYLPRESGIGVGDLIVTSGSDSDGLFPKNLVIGNVVEIIPEPSGLSLYAIVEPVSPIEEIKEVFVITDFLGQGEIRK